MTTRAEHLQWCKDRAKEYLPDRPMDAITSMASDLTKHPETNTPAVAVLALSQALEAQDNPEAVRRWIDDFN